MALPASSWPCAVPFAVCLDKGKHRSKSFINRAAATLPAKVSLKPQLSLPQDSAGTSASGKINKSPAQSMSDKAR